MLNIDEVMPCLLNELLHAGSAALLEGLLAGQHVKGPFYQAGMDLRRGIQTGQEVDLTVKNKLTRRF